MNRFTIALATLALFAGGCGANADAGQGVASLNGAGDGSIAPGSTESMTEEEALLAFTACMRGNGVDIEDPTVDDQGNLRIARPNTGPGAEGDAGTTRDNEDFRAARAECSPLLEGVALGFQDVDRTAIEDQLLEYAACMRDNGFDMPDPDFSTAGGPGGGGPFGAQLDRDDPAFQSAQDACQEILAGIGPRGGGFGGGGRDQGN